LRKPRPDLRTSGQAPRGEPGYLLKLDIDEESVLLSDFELWHYVLNEWDIQVDGSTGRNWDKIFDISWYQKDTTRENEKKAIQATFWEIRLSSVLSAQRFVGR
jgi:hypothetical protein